MELLRTPRVVLRHWHERDLPPYFDLYSRSEVMRWLGRPSRRALADLDEARDRLTRWQERAAGLALPYGLWALLPLGGNGQPDCPVGTVLLPPLKHAHGPTGEVGIGWHLHPSSQGKGLATEAARALLG